MANDRFGSRVLLGISLVVMSAVVACGQREVAPGAAAAGSVEFELAQGATLEQVFNGSAAVLRVQPCKSGSDCIPCDDATKEGLKVQDKTNVHCQGAAGKFCADGGTRIRWEFQGGGLQPKVEYRAAVQYTGAGGKLTGTKAYPKAYCRDANGDQSVCQDSGTPRNLVVFSGLPELEGSAGSLETTYWPYRIDLYQLADEQDQTGTLIACADPEIIVDPPGGATGVPPGGSGS